jgi:FKBP-type peptidyl-prolyl cis-trans isomerase SlyD
VFATLLRGNGSHTLKEEMRQCLSIPSREARAVQIEKNNVATIAYRLSDEDGNLIDSSEGGDPVVYLHGAGNLVPGLEKALEGKSKGDSISVIVPPEDGFGERDDSLVQDVPRERFEGAGKVEVGMQFQARTRGGDRVFRVVDVAGDTIRVDGNHELAGETLKFDVNVIDVRPASPEEIQHGHAHGPGGHHH